MKPLPGQMSLTSLISVTNTEDANRSAAQRADEAGARPVCAWG